MGKYAAGGELKPPTTGMFVSTFPFFLKFLIEIFSWYKNEEMGTFVASFVRLYIIVLGIFILSSC